MLSCLNGEGLGRGWFKGVAHYIAFSLDGATGREYWLTEYWDPVIKSLGENVAVCHLVLIGRNKYRFGIPADSGSIPQKGMQYIFFSREIAKQAGLGVRIQ